MIIIVNKEDATGVLQIGCGVNDLLQDLSS